MVQGSKQQKAVAPTIRGQMALLILGPSHLPASVQRSKLNLLQHSVTHFFNSKIKGDLLFKL